MGIGSLYQCNWQKQNKKNGIKDFKRSIFHWEHFYPIQQQLNDLLGLDDINDNAIFNIISKGKICWIFKEENEVLDSLAKSKRPNPDETYEAAGVNLLGAKQKT